MQHVEVAVRRLIAKWRRHNLRVAGDVREPHSPFVATQSRFGMVITCGRCIWIPAPSNIEEESR
jgi:hypothetical protein